MVLGIADLADETSGAWRRGVLQGVVPALRVVPTSRCVTSDFCDTWTYSTGSSTVMM
jgi:hypothetical protein